MECAGGCGQITDYPWCRRCAGMVRAALWSLPLAYEALDSVIYLTPKTAQRVSGSQSPRSPSPGGDLQDEIYTTVRSWEDDLCAWRRRRERDFVPAPMDDPDSRLVTLTASTDALGRFFETMIDREECAADFGCEVLSLFRRSRSMVGGGPNKRHLSLPCPACDLRALVAEEGIAHKPWYTVCVERLGGCGRLYTEQEISWATGLMLAETR